MIQRIKDYKNEYKNKQAKENKYNKDKYITQNKANNIGFINLNVSKYKVEQNKEIKNEPIVHNTLVYLTRRKPSNKNVTNNIQVFDINKDSKYLTNKNENKNNYSYKIERPKITIKTNYNINEKNKINLEFKPKDKKQENKIIQNKIEIKKENKIEIKKEIKPIRKIYKHKIDREKSKQNENKIITSQNKGKVEEIKIKDDIENKKDNENKEIITDKNNTAINDMNKIKEKIEEIKVEVEEINNINNKGQKKEEEMPKEEIKSDILINDNIPKINDINILKENNLNIDIPSTNLDIYPDINAYDKYNLLTNLELSDETKAFLTSYTYTSSRPELNDYTKAYLDTLNDNSNDIKPELTNLTKEYLSQNIENDDKKTEDNNIDDLIKKEEEN